MPLLVIADMHQGYLVTNTLNNVKIAVNTRDQRYTELILSTETDLD